MRMLVCFRCIDVFTSEEDHRCIPSDDDDAVKAENILIIDYEPVNFKRDFTMSTREAHNRPRSGDFNRLPSNRRASKNNKYFNHLSHNNSLRGKNSPFISEKFVNTSRTISKEYQENDKCIRTLDSNVSSSKGKSSRNLHQDSVTVSASTSMSQTATNYNCYTQNNFTIPILTTSYLHPNVFNANMLLNSRDRSDNYFHDLYDKRSRPETSNYFPQKENVIPQWSFPSSQFLSGYEGISTFL